MHGGWRQLRPPPPPPHNDDDNDDEDDRGEDVKWSGVGWQPCARRSAAMGVFGSWLVLHGGVDVDGNVLGDMWVMNVLSPVRRWSLIPLWAQARFGHVLFEHNSNLCIIGGQLSSDATNAANRDLVSLLGSEMMTLFSEVHGGEMMQRGTSFSASISSRLSSASSSKKKKSWLVSASRTAASVASGSGGNGSSGNSQGSGGGGGGLGFSGRFAKSPRGNSSGDGMGGGLGGGINMKPKATSMREALETASGIPLSLTSTASSSSTAATPTYSVVPSTSNKTVPIPPPGTAAKLLKKKGLATSSAASLVSPKKKLLGRSSGGKLEIGSPTNFSQPVSVSAELTWSGDMNPQEAFELITMVGQGGFGEVWKARHKGGGFTVAVKIVHGDSASTIAALSNEISLLKALRHKYIVPYYGAYEIDEKTLWIFLEYCELGSVADIMETCQVRLNEHQIANVCSNVLEGLAYLHEQRIVHRDIKAANVLVNTMGAAMLTDFGLSERTSTVIAVRAGTPHHMAPEVIAKRGSTEKSDIWSFGITCISMFEGEPPLWQLADAEAMEAIVARPPPKLTGLFKHTKEFAAFIAQCLQKDPNERASAAKLREATFIIKQMRTAPFKAIISKFIKLQTTGRQAPVESVEKEIRVSTRMLKSPRSVKDVSGVSGEINTSGRGMSVGRPESARGGANGDGADDADDDDGVLELQSTIALMQMKIDEYLNEVKQLENICARQARRIELLEEELGADKVAELMARELARSQPSSARSRPSSPLVTSADVAAGADQRRRKRRKKKNEGDEEGEDEEEVEHEAEEEEAREAEEGGQEEMEKKVGEAKKSAVVGEKNDEIRTAATPGNVTSVVPAASSNRRTKSSHQLHQEIDEFIASVDVRKLVSNVKSNPTPKSVNEYVQFIIK